MAEKRIRALLAGRTASDIIVLAGRMIQGSAPSAGGVARRPIRQAMATPTRPASQRTGNACDGDCTGLRPGEATGCGGGTEILLRMSCSAACSLVISMARLSTLCRTKSRLAGAAAIVCSLVASR